MRRSSNRPAKRREQILPMLLMAAGYAVLLFLVFFTYSNSKTKIDLEMKFDSEKSFNSVYMALNDSSSKAQKTMQEEGVLAIGLYSSSGKLYLGLGEAPASIPFERLVRNRSKSDDTTLGVYIYDSENKQIEYFRLSRLNVILETGNFRISNDGIVQVPPDFPEILYVRFDGTEYSRRILTARIVLFISIFTVTFFLAMGVLIYEKNRRYREALAKSESLASLGSAARTLTHEIKNPLSALTIQSALLKKLLPKEFIPDLQTMDNEIQRLTNLTNRVSDFLKNPLGEPKDIEVVSFLRGIARLFENDIVFNTNGIATAYISFDEDRARSVFENIIKNAVESTSERDPQVEIELRISKRKTISIKIKDRGDGLPKELREKIFDPFYTTKIHGSGIGLSISRQFIQARGGRISLRDRDNGGTVVEIVLPCIQTSSMHGGQEDNA